MVLVPMGRASSALLLIILLLLQRRRLTAAQSVEPNLTSINGSVSWRREREQHEFHKCWMMKVLKVLKPSGSVDLSRAAALCCRGLQASLIAL